MKHRVPHDIDKALAKKATEHALESYRARFAEYNPTVTWQNDDHAQVEFKAAGVSIRGKFELTDDEVNIDMEVPLLMRPFRKKAIDVVEREILAWVAKAKNGELDGELDAESDGEMQA